MATVRVTEQDDLLKILREELETSVQALGIDGATARDLVAAYLERIQMRAGGDRYWIPHRRDLERRCEQVVAACSGNNHEEVCTRFGITRRTLRRYLAYSASKVKK
jgi:hypothetical protein